MDDFEAPSFSLGLDEEIHESSKGHAVLRASNPFKLNTADKHRNVWPDAIDTVSLNGSGNIDSDSDFELLPPSSTERIMKRLKREAEKSLSAPSNPQQQVYHASDISKGRGIGSQNPSKGSKEKKSSLPENTPGRKTAISKGQTLQNFWRGLNGKLALPTNSCVKDNGEDRIGTAGQGFGDGSILNKSLESLGTTCEGKIGASEINEATTSANRSVLHGFESKAGLWQGYAESSYDEKGDFSENLGALSRFRTCTNVKTNDELATGKTGQSTAETFESFGNSLHNQRASIYEGFTSNVKGDEAQNCNKSLDGKRSSSFRNDLHCGNSRKDKEAPNQSSWRSLDVKKENLPDNFLGGCESQSLGKSFESPQTSLKHQPFASLLECPTSSSHSKTNTISPSLGKTNALQSFWKSLNEKKSSLDATDVGKEEDDIENCSTDDDFEIGTHSARKLSLCGNATSRKGFSVCTTAADHSSGRCLFNEASAKTISNGNSFAFQYRSNKNSSNARESPALRSAGCTFFANPATSAGYTFSANLGTSPSFVVGDPSQVSAVRNKFQSKQSSFSEKLPEATQRNKVVWHCSDDDNEDTIFFSHSQSKDRVYNDCTTPTHAIASGGTRSLLLDLVSTSDPKVANFLQLRFPHFISVSALRQGDSTGSDQVYIDYENQFSGGKAVSCQSGSRVFKHQARKTAAKSTTKWRQVAQKKQKIAMADNDGWIQTGNRSPAVRCKKGLNGGQRCSQTPVNNDVDSSAGAGHWVTERTGKRIYITKDGRKLSGTFAYKQHIKDSGKRFKKTKRRRPRKKK